MKERAVVMADETTTEHVRKSGTKSPAKTPSTPESETTSTTEPQPPKQTADGHGLRVPIPTVGVRMTRVPLPPGPRTVATGMAHGVSSATTAVRHQVPDRESLLFYGGLGAAAATGLLSWPVAAAVGAGVWVAERVHHESAPAR
ncbi:hypothetical protein AB0B25_29495 [Nocardia sp. NPDC049190]|uniref:hypothetical protein n=1 Tax=Nocardia sp. NPDC049190 TaxID=3155650 RepID=UPI0033CFE7DE